jgi:hypothetical protein
MGAHAPFNIKKMENKMKHKQTLKGFSLFLLMSTLMVSTPCLSFPGGDDDDRNELKRSRSCENLNDSESDDNEGKKKGKCSPQQEQTLENQPTPPQAPVIVDSWSFVNLSHPESSYSIRTRTAADTVTRQCFSNELVNLKWHEDFTKHVSTHVVDLIVRDGEDIVYKKDNVSFGEPVPHEIDLTGFVSYGAPMFDTSSNTFTQQFHYVDVFRGQSGEKRGEIDQTEAPISLTLQATHLRFNTDFSTNKAYHVLKLSCDLLPGFSTEYELRDPACALPIITNFEWKHDDDVRQSTLSFKAYIDNNKGLFSTTARTIGLISTFRLQSYVEVHGGTLVRFGVPKCIPWHFVRGDGSKFYPG